MRTAVIIPSRNRVSHLRQILLCLARQEVLPDEVVVSVPSVDHLCALDGLSLNLLVVTGNEGASRQRNSGIAAVSPTAELMLFLDDDMVIARDYLANAIKLFLRHPGIAGASGTLLADGAALKKELDTCDGLRLLEQTVARSDGVKPVRSLYGCNMIARRSMVANWFDERLVGYSWLEDFAFSRNLAQSGELVQYEGCLGVHLGSESGGRVNHERFGYSQVLNPVFLWRKGPLQISDIALHTTKGVAGNAIFSLRREDGKWRRARFRGNLRALSDLVAGRMEPSRVLTGGASAPVDDDRG